MYNIKARLKRRVVRAGRRSTIGNRVSRNNGFVGSNPMLSAKETLIALILLGLWVFLYLFKKKILLEFNYQKLSKKIKNMSSNCPHLSSVK